jgi:hypothetical protein
MFPRNSFNRRETAFSSSCNREVTRACPRDTFLRITDRLKLDRPPPSPSLSLSASSRRVDMELGSSDNEPIRLRRMLRERGCSSDEARLGSSTCPESEMAANEAARRPNRSNDLQSPGLPFPLIARSLLGAAKSYRSPMLGWRVGHVTIGLRIKPADAGFPVGSGRQESSGLSHDRARSNRNLLSFLACERIFPFCLKGFDKRSMSGISHASRVRVHARWECPFATFLSRCPIKNYQASE